MVSSTAVIWFSVRVPGLVRVDGRGRTQRLHRAQPLHDGAGLGQRLRPERQQGGDHRRQAGRHRRHREGDRRDEQGFERQVVDEVAQRDRRHQRQAGDDDDLVGERVELTGERRLLVLGRLQHAGDVPDLGASCRCAITTSSPDPRVALVFMKAMSTRSPSGVSTLGIGVDLLRHGGALAGQGRLVDLQGGRLDDPPRRRGSGRRLPRPRCRRVPARARGPGPARPSRRTRLWTIIIFCRAATLASALPSWLSDMTAFSRVRPNSSSAVSPLANDDQADDGRAEQHDLHRVLVLAHELAPAGFLLRLGELVRPVLSPSLLDLGAAQAAGRVDALRLERVVDGQRVPRRALMRVPERSSGTSSVGSERHCRQTSRQSGRRRTGCQAAQAWAIRSGATCRSRLARSPGRPSPPPRSA